MKTSKLQKSSDEGAIARRVFVTGLFVSGCVPIVIGGGGTPSGPVPKAKFEGGETSLQNDLGIPAMNAFRAQHGAQPLSAHEACSQAALQQAHYLARTGHVDHVVPGVGELGDVVTRLRYFKVPKPHGENLSWGYQNAERAAAGWYGSPGHHETMLRETYKSAGMAMATHPNTGGTKYWCAVYTV